jgi:predicted amidohydrolase YtcJ
MLFKHVDLRTPGCRSIADVLAKLKGAIPSMLFDGWLLAQANLFFDQKLTDRRFPTKDELDVVAPDIPIAIRAGGHLTLLNSKALAVSGIDRNYVPPEYSVMGRCVVERDATGDPIGIVKEMDDVLPMPRATGEDLRQAIESGARELFTRFGVTSIGEISESIEGLETYSLLQRENRMALRVAPHLWVPGTMSLEEACHWRDHIRLVTGPEWFDVKSVKIFSDGGYSSANAVCKQPYLQTGSCGEMGMTLDEIRHVYEKAAAAGLGLAVHANGEVAQETVCQAVLHGKGPFPDTVVRLEHGGNFLPDYEVTTDWWRRAKILPCPQPTFLYALGDFFPIYLGDYGNRGRFPFRRMLEDGWPVPGSSDVFAGGESGITNPFFGIWCAVERQTYRGEVIDPDQRLSVDEALYMYTMDAARLLGHERQKGSLEPGKLADVIVLDRNPRHLNGEELRDTKVDHVFVAGRHAYARS